MVSTLWNKKTASVACVSFVALALLFVPESLVSGQTADFSLSANPTSLCVNPGINAVSVINLASEGGFAGTVSLGASVGPGITNGPTLSGVPASETLASGQSVSFDLTVSTTASTPLYSYYVTVSGLSGSSFHDVSVQVTVGSSCSVGGTVLPFDQLAILSPYLAIGALTIAGIGLGITVIVFRARRK